MNCDPSLSIVRTCAKFIAGNGSKGPVPEEIPVRFSKQRIETKELKYLKSKTLLRLAMQTPFLSLRGFHGFSGECNMAVSWTLSTKASLKSYCPENSQRWGAFVFDGTAMHSPRQFEWSLISGNTTQHGAPYRHQDSLQ